MMSNEEEIVVPEKQVNLSREEQELLMKEIEAKDLAEFMMDNRGAPPVPDHYSIMVFFRDVLGLDKIDDWLKFSKVGNLDSRELGLLNHSVRRYNDIGFYAESEDLDEVSKYLYGKSANILASSLSKKGFLISTAVTQKKISKNLGPVKRVEHKGMFGSKVVTEGEEDS